MWARVAAIAAVWLGLSALFGTVTVLDLVVVGVVVLVFVPVSSWVVRRRARKDDSLYGPPQ